MKTILVVDDEFDVVSATVAALNDEGYRVLVGSNGIDGMRLLQETKPELLMCDLMMPLMDGFTMIQLVRRDPACRQMPILVMSALNESAVSTMVPGYDGFLRKPFRISRLLEAVGALT
jgi:two-component system alkaline phosphatase synthesis response regulator PhoP